MAAREGGGEGGGARADPVPDLIRRLYVKKNLHGTRKWVVSKCIDPLLRAAIGINKPMRAC